MLGCFCYLVVQSIVSNRIVHSNVFLLFDIIVDLSFILLFNYLFSCSMILINTFEKNVSFDTFFYDILFTWIYQTTCVKLIWFFIMDHSKQNQFHSLPLLFFLTHLKLLSIFALLLLTFVSCQNCLIKTEPYQTIWKLNCVHFVSYRLKLLESTVSLVFLIYRDRLVNKEARHQGQHSWTKQ